jgi:DNA-binding transcriptional ArsR family regulator
LRNFLQLLSAACNLELGVRDVQPLKPEVILALMAPRFATKIREQIGATDYAHLLAMFKRSDLETELRVTDIARRTKIHQTSASQLVGRLLRHGLLVASRTEARNTYYRPAGNTGIALGLA